MEIAKNNDLSKNTFYQLSQIIFHENFSEFIFENSNEKFNSRNYVDIRIVSSLLYTLSTEFIYIKYGRNGCTFPLPLPDYLTS